ncbi:purine-nucleoside phosphorylase [Peptoniphilaceae bacterium SGI.131]
MEYNYEYFKKAADYIREKVDFVPEIGLILGSCLGPLAKRIKNPVEIDYKDIPNFLRSTVSSHAGKLILGEVEGRKVVCMSGRFHFYEGYDFEQLVIPVRVLKLLGIKALIITNAAGGINTSYTNGDVMLIKDHIKLFGASPLRGKNVEEFGDRFFDVSNMYTKDLRRQALELAKDSGLRVHEGNYYFASGPQFETPAEINAMRILGGDAVGMSTVTEAVTAAHCKLPLLGISVITNMAAGVVEELTTQEVDDTAKMIEEKFSGYVESIIRQMQV